MEAVETNSVANTPPVPGADSILLGPGAAVPAPFFDVRGVEEPGGGNVLLGAVHSLRRRWFPIAVLGLVLGIAAGFAFWFFTATEYTAVARVRVPLRESILPVGDAGETVTDFDHKKRLQMALITNQSVLESTLLDPAVIRLSAISSLADKDAQFAWLRSHISVAFPGNNEVMELKVRATDKDSAMTLAERIRFHYLKHQENDLTDRATEIRLLEIDLQSYKDTYRLKRDELVRLEEQAGGGPPLTPEEQERIRQRQRHWDSLNEIDEQIWSAQADLETVQKSISGESPLVLDEELQAYLESDDAYKSMNRRKELLEQDLEKQKSRLGGKAYEKFEAATQDKIKVIDEGIAELTKSMREAVEFQKRKTLAKATPAQIQEQIDKLGARRRYLNEEIDKLTPKGEEVEQGAIPWVRIEMARYEAENLRAKMDRIQRQLDHAELAKLKDLDRQRAVGIRVWGDAFHLAENDERRKLLQSCAAGGAVFMVVSALIVLLDLRRHRLNDTADVASVLQLNVLGTVPLLRGKGAKRLEQSARLAEAVDGVAATLLCRTAGSDHRVVMISSAMAGEGKTTLAANLATSLAAAGRRTLLVDFDLRRPMLHQVYQVPIGPGLGELLSGGELSEFGDYLHETMTENLWLIPAGARRQAALAALSDERVAELFQEFKEHFEFIIVDGPPVLLVVDTRLVARHADGVVISMLRDVSELPKVKAACQLLQSYRVQILGGVVIGAAGDVYYGYAPERFSTIA